MPIQSTVGQFPIPTHDCPESIISAGKTRHAPRSQLVLLVILIAQTKEAGSPADLKPHKKKQAEPLSGETKANQIICALAQSGLIHDLKDQAWVAVQFCQFRK